MTAPSRITAPPASGAFWAGPSGCPRCTATAARSTSSSCSPASVRRRVSTWCSPSLRDLRDRVELEQENRDLQAARRRLDVQHAVANALAAAERLPEVMPGVLAALCRSLEFDCAGFWTVDARHAVLRCVATWEGAVARCAGVPPRQPAHHLRPWRGPAGPGVGERSRGRHPRRGHRRQRPASGARRPRRTSRRLRLPGAGGRRDAGGDRRLQPRGEDARSRPAGDGGRGRPSGGADAAAIARRRGDAGQRSPAPPHHRQPAGADLLRRHQRALPVQQPRLRGVARAFPRRGARPSRARGLRRGGLGDHPAAHGERARRTHRRLRWGDDLRPGGREAGERDLCPGPGAGRERRRPGGAGHRHLGAQARRGGAGAAARRAARCRRRARRVPVDRVARAANAAERAAAPAPERAADAAPHGVARRR